MTPRIDDQGVPITTSARPSRLPSVGIVIATHNRPELLGRALRSFHDQDYQGPVRIVVVHDRCEVDHGLAAQPNVDVMANERTPGLAGARNSGVLRLDTDMVAFCDDDDWWKPDKLRRQVDMWLARGRPPLVTCSIEVDFEGSRSERRAGLDTVTVSHLTRSRMAMLHSSTLLFDRQRLLDDIGLVDEEVPGSQNEDWDILLRSAKVAPIAHLDEPLVVVQWGYTSFYARAWESRVSSLHYMLEAHPEIGRDRRGLARVQGQIAFGTAALGRRREAVEWARKTIATDVRQWRAPLALVVASGAVSAEQVLNFVHRFGRGI